MGLRVGFPGNGGIIEAARPANSCSYKSTNQMPGCMSSGENTNEDLMLNEAWGADVNSAAPGMRLAPVQTQLHQNSPYKFPVTPIQTLCPLETLDPSRVCLSRVRGDESLFSTSRPTTQSTASVAIKPNWLRLL